MKVTVDLVIRRGNEPFKGILALPGGFVDEDETVECAAVRELEEETSVRVTEDRLRLIGVFSRVDRDPRGRTITVAYFCEMPRGTRAQETMRRMRFGSRGRRRNELASLSITRIFWTRRSDWSKAAPISRASLRRPAPVHHQGSSCHKGRRIGREKGGRAHQIADRADPAKLDLRDDALPESFVFQVRARHRRLDEGRAQRVDADAMRA
jgi:ADP-ribose pyrophosphatase YjhB (NUDIX family)